MRVGIEKLIEKIEKAVEENSRCAGNLLLNKRVFFCTRNGKFELLVSLNNRMQRPHYWGHVFWKSGGYISLIMAVDYWLNAATCEELFVKFWNNLEERGRWYPISGDVFSTANEFDKACEELARMIKRFDEGRAHSEVDSRVVMAYPFPNPFQETA